MNEKVAENPAVSNFRRYLRINTMQPSPDYALAAKFLQEQADELGLPCNMVECHPGMPVVIITWLGSKPELPSVLLNSHIDVVPVFEDCWKYPPFSAHKDEKGDIYARGAQDMKCVGIQYIEAVRRLKAAGRVLPRTIHMSFVPDEEIGGEKGMDAFSKTPQFRALNIGFAMDEGLGNPTDKFTLFYGERMPWWVKVTCTGDPGHGSRFVENSAAEKLRKVINNFLTYRDSEEQKLKDDPSLRLGDVTTTNLNIVEGGVQINVIPAEFTAKFDIRVTPTLDLEKFEAKIHKMCADAGSGVKYEFLQKNMNQNLTSISSDDPWYSAFKAACDKHGVKLEPEIFPAATDSRFLRALGLPALGFSPMNNTPILLHDHNEFLNEQVFLRGIDIYCDIIPNLASVPAK